MSSVEKALTIARSAVARSQVETKDALDISVPAALAVMAAPDDPEVLLLAATAVMTSPKASRAVEWIERAFANGAERAGPALHHLGIALCYAGRMTEGIDALAECESSPSRDFDLGTMLALTGALHSGLFLREARIKLLNYDSRGLPWWDGRETDVLWVHSEQGLGDTINWSRYIGWARGFCRRLVFSVQPELLGLFEDFSSADEVRASEPNESIPEGATAIVPLMSLQRFYRREPYTCEDPPAPDAEFFRSRASDRFRDTRHLGITGLAWSASKRPPFGRSIPVEDLAALDRVSDLWSIQVGEYVPRWLPSFEMKLGDWRDTVAVLSKLDRVVTVDTAVAHLSGSMKVPTTLLLPKPCDWKWGLEGSRTPWYESVEIVRQDAPGDWKPALRRVAEQLSK